MGENNSTYLCRIPYKVAGVADNTLKQPAYVSEALVTLWPWVVFLRFSTLTLTLS